MAAPPPEMPPPEILRAFAVTAPEPAATTAIATVWKVAHAAGGLAALKIYHNGDMKNEAEGFRFLQRAGARAAEIYALQPGAVLMEWLDGPSLGDLVREGHDRKAAENLVAVARDLHARPAGPADGYARLEDWFAALFDLVPADGCAAGVRRGIASAQALARGLLASQTDIRPLHGDLHHDNIRQGARGWCAFDAKGVAGERAYELANAFRNPVGVPKLVRSPERIARLADCWSDGFGVDRQRLLQWAAAKCALSIAWRCEGPLLEDPDCDLLGLLLRAARD